MTSGNFEAMNEAAQRDLARRLWEGSDVFDFETALELVQRRPDMAREILQDAPSRRGDRKSELVVANGSGRPLSKTSARPRRARESR